MAMAYRLSIAERIALTHGFQTSSDSRVLTALASFGHFETGANAHPSVETLQSRIPDLSVRTIARCLARLEAEGWIIGTRQHRRPTNYAVHVGRLATSPTRAKAVESDYTFDCQSGSQGPVENLRKSQSLSATLSGLTATLSGLTAKVAVHPVFDLDLDPTKSGASAPIALHGEKHDDDDPKTAGERAPHQLTLGPQAVSSTTTRPASNFAKLADVMRTALQDAKRRSG